MHGLLIVGYLRLVSILYYACFKQYNFDLTFCLIIGVEIFTSFAIIYISSKSISNKKVISLLATSTNKTESFDCFLKYGVLFSGLALSFVSAYFLRHADFGIRLTGQDIQGKGPLFIINTIILPVIIFATVLYKYKSFLIKLLCLLLFLASIVIFSLVFLTKAGIVSLCFMIGLYMIRERISKSYLFILAPIFCSILYYVYMLRGTSTSVVEILDLLLLRIPTLEVMLVIYPGTSNWFQMPYLNISDLIRFVTEDLFNRDAQLIGIAPGLSGFFIIQFGLLGGPFLLMIFVLIFTKFDEFIVKLPINSRLRILISDYIFVNFVVFFIDGVPTFITLTEGGLFFIINVIMLCIFICSIAFRHNLRKMIEIQHGFGTK